MNLWRYHHSQSNALNTGILSITAAMGFPLRGKITGGHPIKMKFTFHVRVDFQVD